MSINKAGKREGGRKREMERDGSNGDITYFIHTRPSGEGRYRFVLTAEFLMLCLFSKYIQTVA